MHHKKGVSPSSRPYYQTGPKGFQQPPSHYTYTQEGPSVFQFIPKRPDVVGYTGGSGGAGRVSLSVPPQFSTVAAPHPPPNSAPQGQQSNQNPQLRAQAPSLPPSHNPQHGAGGPPPSVPHSQHHPHSHSALAQHQHHLSGANVSGATGGHVNPVQQSAVPVPPGQSPAPPGPPHELNAQGIPQPSSQQIQQGSVPGVALPGTVAGSMMFSSTNPNHHNPTPQTNAQFFHPGQQQQNATHLPAGGTGQRHLLTHSQHGMPNFPFQSIMPSQILHPTSPLFSQYPPISTQRSGNSTAQPPQYQQLPAQPPTYHPQHMSFQMPGFPQSMDSNGKSYPKSPFHGASTVYYPQSQQQQPKPQPSSLPQARSKRIPIIDPVTNKNILDDYNPKEPSHNISSSLESRESSATNTPAPGEVPQNKSQSPDVPSQFALQVAVVHIGDTNITNEQSDTVDCTISTNTSIEPSPCVLNSDNREKDRLLSCVDNKNEPVVTNEIQSTRSVPEHNNSVSKADQSVMQPPPSLPPSQTPCQSQPVASTMPKPQQPQPHPQQQQQQQLIQPQQQPPPQQQQQLQPQPQRPPKQSRAAQSQATSAAPTTGNQVKTTQPPAPPQQQQQGHSKQPSPPHHGKQNQGQQKNAGGHSSSKGSQNVQGGQQQSQPPKGSAPPVGQKGAPHSVPQQQQQPQQSLPQTKQQPKLPAEPVQQTSTPVSQQVQQMPPPTSHIQQPFQSPAPQQAHAPTQSQGQPMKGQGTHQIQGSLQPQQKPQPQGQGYRGPSPPQHVSSQVASRRLSSEQIAPASVAPAKQVEKRPSPPVEQITPESTEPSPKDAPVKQGGSKNASPSPVPSASKKEATPEPSHPPVGKRGKEKPPEDVNQSKDGKELVKGPADDLSPRTPETPQQQPPNKQPPHGKPPKTQPPSAEKSAESTTQASTPSQTPKSQSPVPQGHSRNLPEEKDGPSEPPTREPKDLRQENPPPPPEEHVNNIDEPKVANHEENHIGDKPKSSSLLKYPYKEGQWTPENPEGKLQYDRDFLLEMQKNPLSLKRPDSLPNLEVVLDGPVRPIDGKQKIQTDFTPFFLLQNSGRGKNQKVVTRGSQQGRIRPTKVIDIKLNSSSEKILKTSENAWKPTVKKSDDFNSFQEAKHEETIKKMRGILNKLTPDNFERLVTKVKEMNIDDFHTFDAVIGLIFEKAVDEQAFSTTYAELCKVLSQMSVKVHEKDETRFRNLLISKCQAEFEKDNRKDLNRDKREKEIDQQPNSDKKTELKSLLDFEESRLRKRSVGNIRFIGELYKLRMLTSPIMMRIIRGLLDKKDEESLECLCKLLTTIGKLLHTSVQNIKKSPDDFNDIFDSMKKLVDTRCTSSRVRFLMMDVIDLRKNNWVPRREDSQPKTKAQVHEEIKKEEMEQAMSLLNTPRKDDRERKRSRDNRGMMVSDDLWTTVSNTRRGHHFDYTRLRNETFNRGIAENEMQFRGAYGNWGRGSSGGFKEQQQEEESRPPSNRFALLDPSLSERRTNQMQPRLGPGGNAQHRHDGGSFGSKSMPPPSEKENVLSSVKKMVTPAGDRSKSNSRSNSRTGSRESSLAREPPIPERDATPQMNRTTAQKYTKSIIEEYVHNFDLKEATLCFQEKFKGGNIPLFIHFSLEWVIEKDSEKMKRVGVLYHHLIKERLITIAQLTEGAKETMEYLPELEIDVPQVCTYVGEILCRLLVQNVVKLQDILKILEPADKLATTAFAKVIKQMSKVIGESSMIDLWNREGLTWKAVLGQSGINTKKYLEKHDIEFIMGTPTTAKTQENAENIPFDPKFVKEELTKLFKNKASDEEIFGWVDIHVGQYTNTKKFVRALTTALIESLLTMSDSGSVVLVHDFDFRLKQRTKFIQKYADNNQSLELACIYAMQSLAVENQHPPGLLEHSFNVMYDQEALSGESFLEWEKDNDPVEQLGKGVCITSVRKYLEWLRDECDG